MVEHRALTLAEIAEKYGTTLTMVQKKWSRRESWPRPVGKRGRAGLFDAVEVEAEYRRIVGLPDPEGSPDDLLTWKGVCAYLGRGGVALKTMEWRRWKGLWPPGAVGADGVERWRRDVVEEAHARIVRSRGPKPKQFDPGSILG